MSYVVFQGIFTGLVALAGIVAMTLTKPDFLRTKYWLWLLGAFGCALLGPLTYTWIQDSQLSYSEAATLTVLRAGAWHVSRGYGLLLGVVLGGLASSMINGRPRLNRH